MMLLVSLTFRGNDRRQSSIQTTIVPPISLSLYPILFTSSLVLDYIIIFVVVIFVVIVIIVQTSWVDYFIDIANTHPYLWAVYAILLVLPFVLCAACCVKSKVLVM